MAKVGWFLNRTIAYLSHAGAIVGVYGLLFMTGMITVDVILRYFFAKPLMFGVEYSGYLLVFIVYLALGYTARVGGHINADFVVRRLPTRQHNLIDMTTLLVTLGLISLFLCGAWDLWIDAVQSGQESTTIMRTPLWVPYTFMWVGLVIFILDVVVLIVKKFRDLSKRTD